MNYTYYQYPQNFAQPAPDQLQILRQQQLMQAPLIQMQNQNPDERIWVTGRASADAYLVAPNSFVRLWDSSANVYYEKRADSTGKPYMDVFEYKKVGEQAPTPEAPHVDYMTEIEELKKRIKVLEEREVKQNE